MKKIKYIVFIFAVLLFTACTDEVNTSTVSETKETQESEEKTTDSTTKTEMSDKEYLINLANQLELGMPYDSVIEELGEPDEYLGSGILRLRYGRGDWNLLIEVGSPYGEIAEVRIYNSELGEKIILIPAPDNETIKSKQ